MSRVAVEVADLVKHYPKASGNAVLDPQARLTDRDDARRGRHGVVLTTHDMDEAHKLSDRAGIVGGGDRGVHAAGHPRVPAPST